MWEIDVSGQIYTLLFSLALGGAFCILFDLYKALRIQMQFSAVAVFVWDVILLSLFGVVDFLFFLATTNGEIRGYVLFVEGLGFVLFRLTVSRILQPLFSWLILLFKRLKSLLYSTVFAPVGRFFDGLFKKMGSIGLKSAFFIKKRLKKPRKMVYTDDNCMEE